jgi:hypothetical protein
MQMMCEPLLVIMAIRTIDISDIHGSTHLSKALTSALFATRYSMVDAFPPLDAFIAA